MGEAKSNGHRRDALLALFVVGVLAIGLLALVGANSAWAASRTFVQASGCPLAV